MNMCEKTWSDMIKPASICPYGISGDLYQGIWEICMWGIYIYTHMYIYICESTVGSSSVMFIVHWCPRATNLFHPRLVAQDARRSHMEGKSDRWRCFGIREFNTYTITVKDQYKHKHWVTAHSQYIYIIFTIYYIYNMSRSKHELDSRIGGCLSID
jgi:hypothetical protein